MGNDNPARRSLTEESDIIKGETVEVIVGPVQRRLFVHVAVLQKSSAFFATALKKDWKEGQIRRVPLPEEEEEIIQAYVYWLYCQKFSRTDGEKTMSFLRLVKLYGLGEKLMDDEFQDGVVDAIIAGTRSFLGEGGGPLFPSSRSVKIIYDSTPQGSPGRKLMVDLYVSSAAPQWIRRAEDQANTSVEFLVDLSRALLDDRQHKRKCSLIEQDTGISSCSYHKHGPGSSCGAVNGAKRTKT